MCRSQVLVSYDVLGLFDAYVQPFVKQNAKPGEAILSATENCAHDVREGMYPQPRKARNESAAVLALK